MKEIHSFAIDGQVGLGKTTLIKEIVKELESAGDLCSLEDATFSTPGLKDELLGECMTNIPPTFFIEAANNVIRSKHGMDKVPWVSADDLFEKDFNRLRDYMQNTAHFFG